MYEKHIHPKDETNSYWKSDPDENIEELIEITDSNRKSRTIVIRKKV
jgi:hypothetical protein